MKRTISTLVVLTAVIVATASLPAAVSSSSTPPMPPATQQAMALVNQSDVPVFEPGELVIGLTADDTTVRLFTNRFWYESPRYSGSGLAWTQFSTSFPDLGIFLSALSRVALAPSVAPAPKVIYLAGSGNALYTLTLDSPVSVNAGVAIQNIGVRPKGIAVNSAGTVYLLCDLCGTPRVVTVDPADGTTSGAIGGSGTGALVEPTAMAIGPTDIIYVLDKGDGTIKSFEPDGDFLGSFPLVNTDELTTESAMGIGPDNRLYVNPPYLSVYDATTGTFLGMVDQSTDQGINLNPQGHPSVAMDSNGVLYDVTGSGSKVHVFTTQYQDPLEVIGAPNVAAYGASFSVTTNGGSGAGAVTFNVTGPCSNSLGGPSITMTGGSGACGITATKAGDATYMPATSGTDVVSAAKAEQTDVTPTEANQSAIPGLGFGEFVAGLQTAGSDAFLFTTLTWYTSPAYNGGNLNFVASGFLFSSLSVILGPTTRVAHNPADSASERIFYLTGGAGAFGNSLYTLRLPSSGPPDAEEVAIALAAKPNGIAVGPTGTVYLLCGACSPARVATVDPTTGLTGTPFGMADEGALSGPSAIAIDTDGKVYVLDSGNARIAVYGADGTFIRAFPVANVDEIIADAAMTFGANHQLFVTNTAAVPTATVRGYNTVTGALLNSFDRSTDLGFNPIGKPAITYDPAGYLYDVTGTGNKVHVTALNAPSALTVIGAPASAVYGASLTVSTTGGVGTGAVVFNATGACSNTSGGALVTMTSGTGTCTIDATKAGDDNYAPATSAAVNVTAVKASQTDGVPSAQTPGTIPGLDEDFGAGERVVGLASRSAKVDLFTTKTWYTSPGYSAGPLNLVNSGIGWADLTSTVRPESKIARDPNDSDSLRIFYMTGGPSTSNLFYTMRLDPEATLTRFPIQNLGGRPNGIAISPTGTIYLLCAICAPARVATIDPSTGLTGTPFGMSDQGALSNPQAITIDADGEVFVLDSGNARIAVYDAAGTFLRSFRVANVDEIPVDAAMTFGANHQLFVTNTTAVPTATVRGYNALTGALLNSFDRSTDLGINPGGKPAIAYDPAGYLYDVTGTGNKVHVTALTAPSALTVTGAPASAANGATFTVSTTGGVGTGGVTFNATGACSNSSGGALITMTAATGTCSIQATKAGDDNYEPTSSDAVTVTASKAAQATLTVIGAPASAVYGASFTVSTTGGTGTGAVTFSATGACGNTAGGALITMTAGSGTCTIQALKAADDNYESTASDIVNVTAAKAAQTAVPLTSANQGAIPTLRPNESIIGITADDSVVDLFTTRTLYESSAYTGTAPSLVDSGIDFLNTLSIRLTTASKVARDPSVPSTTGRVSYLTGSAGILGNFLYKLTYPTGSLPSATEVPIQGLGARPNGIAVNSLGTVYLLCNAACGTARVATIDLSNGVTSPPFGTTGAGTLINPTAIAIGPTNVVYVLDKGDGTIKSYDATGVYLGSFPFANAAELTDDSAMTVGPNHQLFVVNTTTTTAFLRAYNTVTGALIGEIDQSADLGFSPGGKPGIAQDANGYVYDVTGTGALVHVSRMTPLAALTVTGAPASAASGASVTVSTTGGTGTGAVTFSVTGACSNTAGGALITMTSGTGTCSIQATKAGDDNYEPTSSETVNVNATKAAQAALTLTGVPASAANGSSFIVVPGGGSSSAPLVVSTTGVCNAAGNLITMTAASGVCTVRVNRAGDSNYDAAQEVTATSNATAGSSGGAPLTLNPTSVQGTKNSTATVTIPVKAPKGGTIVTLSSSNPSVATVPASVTVSAGATTKNFNVTTFAVAAPVDVTISTLYSGVTRTATLRVLPPTPTTVKLNPDSVSGGTASTATVTLSGPAPVGGLTVPLVSSNPAVASVPVSVVVPAGKTSAQAIVNTTPVAVQTAVTISASYDGVTKQATLTVKPAPRPRK